jgi:hypothetical protein
VGEVNRGEVNNSINREADMSTKWLIVVVATVVLTLVTVTSALAKHKQLIITYDASTGQVVSVKDEFGREAKEYPTRFGIPEPLTNITRVETPSILSDFASPGCVCYDNKCVCD